MQQPLKKNFHLQKHHLLNLLKYKYYKEADNQNSNSDKQLHQVNVYVTYLEIKKRQVKELVDVLETKPIAHGCLGVTYLCWTRTSEQHRLLPTINFLNTYIKQLQAWLPTYEKSFMVKGSGVATTGTGDYIVPPSSGLVPPVPPKSKMRLMSKF